MPAKEKHFYADEGLVKAPEEIFPEMNSYKFYKRKEELDIDLEEEESTIVDELEHPSPEVKRFDHRSNSIKRNFISLSSLSDKSGSPTREVKSQKS